MSSYFVFFCRRVEAISKEQQEGIRSHSRTRRRKILVNVAGKIVGFVEGNAFIIISAIFVLFNVIYWSWLLIGSGYFEWHVDPRLNQVMPQAEADELDNQHIQPT